tara:strand:+ start:18783 stop:19637 length:855 start_codon:yes stop_codon:yes gene_type:complete
MVQIGTVKVYTATGMQELPVFELGDSGADIYEILKVRVDGNVGFIPMANPAGGTPDRPFLKVYSDVGGGTVLEGHSAAAFAPTFTTIEDFSALNTANYQLNYSGGLYTTVASPVSISPNSAKHESTTAGTLISTNGSTTLPAYPAVGDTIKLDIYMSSTGATYQQIILYFGTGAANNQTYRMQLDYKGNSALYAVATGGSPSTLDSTTFSSRPVGTWLELSIDWKDTVGSTTTIDCIDKSTGLSILTAPLSSTNSAQDGNNGIGFYCKSASSSPIYLNTLRFTT